MGQTQSSPRRGQLSPGDMPCFQRRSSFNDAENQHRNNNNPDELPSTPLSSRRRGSDSGAGVVASPSSPPPNAAVSHSPSAPNQPNNPRWSLSGMLASRHITPGGTSHATVIGTSAATTSLSARSSGHPEDHSQSSSGGGGGRFSGMLRFRRTTNNNSSSNPNHSEEETTSASANILEPDDGTDIKEEGEKYPLSHFLSDEEEPDLILRTPPTMSPSHSDEPPSLVDFEESEDGGISQAAPTSTAGRRRSEQRGFALMGSWRSNQQQQLDNNEESMRSLLTSDPAALQGSSSDLIRNSRPAAPGGGTGGSSLSVHRNGGASSSTVGGIGGLNVESHDSAQRSSSNSHNNNNSSNTSNNATVSFDNSTTGAAFYYSSRRRGRVNSVTESESTLSDDMDEEDDLFARGTRNAASAGVGGSSVDFYPQASREYEWMGRSIESLMLGHTARAPMLQLIESDDADDPADFYTAARRRSTASTFGGGPAYARRRSSQGSFPGGRRGSLSLSGGHGGTLANYYNRRRPIPTDVDRTDRQGRRGSTSHTPMYRRRSSMAASGNNGGSSPSDDLNPSRTSFGNKGGPNVVYSVMARESTGKSCFPRNIPNTQCLRAMGGYALFSKLDKPADSIATEVAFLAAAIDSGDWSETQTIISRLAPRLIGDPMSLSQDRSVIDDPNLPPTAHRFYAGGGRVGLERDAFVQAGGVEILIRIFREKTFVGQEMSYSYDARDLSAEIVATRLAPCWNEALAALRELVFSIPSLVDDRKISDNEEFLPFLFTLLSHDSCFDGAAALIEEILALLSQTPQQQMQTDPDLTLHEAFQPTGRVSPPITFFLGNVPGLYRLWAGFNCRQLAHFCRILALLVFEPEDRQLLDSPAILKSLELLQLRRNRAVRASRDSTVDMNQSILLGDPQLIKRLLMLLKVLNFAPSLRRIAPYHVIAQYPLVTETLVMLGHGELESWSEAERQELLARKLLEEDLSSDESPPLLCELGRVAEMLEGLSDTLSEAPNQIGHIIHVISAAQQAGVIVGRASSRERRRHQMRPSGSSPADPAAQEAAAEVLRVGGLPVDNATIQGLASVAGILTDQVLVRRLYQTTGQDIDGSPRGFGDFGEDDESNDHRYFINTPEDSANSLQFNAILLGTYQVEILFVLCTLLGGRRKLDAQNMLENLGLVQVLEDMFQRLPWFRRTSEDHADDERGDQPFPDSQPNGIHGPGCECTPESALCVQYLRLLHNFCDRDCDNYSGRRLLLSPSEREMVFRGVKDSSQNVTPGLLSKVIGAFVKESDESPYRFWLASCVESYLRGSSPEEQMFVAQSGLMSHLIEDVSSDRLHCAGSLQTSFDLLGELGKGNSDVVRLLVNDLDEESFRKLMSVAAANLVDSNVFIRSLLLSLERLSASDCLTPVYKQSPLSSPQEFMWASQLGTGSRCYLTHSWWDTRPFSILDASVELDQIEEDRPSDWFPTREFLEVTLPPHVGTPPPPSLDERIGHFGWVFTPSGDSLSPNTYLSNTVERLSWFLAANQARLLRDLLGVVDLRNINHENICCLNTAVVIAIFAHRRRQLSSLLEELRQMSDEESETKRRAINAGQHDDVVDRAFAQAMRYLDLDQRETPPPYARIGSVSPSNSFSPSGQIGDRTDVMRNFREVLWFWSEYYTHRGRDRLSLEFSSHLRFQEWNHVVSLLVADDGSPTALLRSPPHLPRSPYQRAARISDSPMRGV